MKIALATFVKTPGMSPIKTRLGQTIGTAAALEFYVKSLAATYETVSAVKNHFAIAPYWAVAEKQALGAIFWQKWPQIWQGEGGLGDRLARVYTELKKQYDVVGFYGADSPHIKSEELVSALMQIKNEETSTVVGPTEDGGFYFLASRLPVTSEVWTSVEYSQNTTLQQLLNKWPDSHVKKMNTHFDIDTDKELERLRKIDQRF